MKSMTDLHDKENREVEKLYVNSLIKVLKDKTTPKLITCIVEDLREEVARITNKKEKIMRKRVIKDFWYYLGHKDWVQDTRTGWFHNIKNGKIVKFNIVLK